MGLAPGGNYFMVGGGGGLPGSIVGGGSGSCGGFGCGYGVGMNCGMGGTGGTPTMTFPVANGEARRRYDLTYVTSIELVAELSKRGYQVSMF